MSLKDIKIIKLIFRFHDIDNLHLEMDIQKKTCS